MRPYSALRAVKGWPEAEGGRSFGGGGMLGQVGVVSVIGVEARRGCARRHEGTEGRRRGKHEGRKVEKGHEGEREGRGRSFGGAEGWGSVKRKAENMRLYSALRAVKGLDEGRGRWEGGRLKVAGVNGR